MADKTPAPTHFAVAVAPAARGFVNLGHALVTACERAGHILTGPPRLLGSEGKWVAVELPVWVTETPLPAGDRSASALLPPEDRADAALIPVQNRRKKLLVSDMDSTIIQQECLDELADYAGVKDEVAAITARAMAGDLDFEGALTARVAMLKGLPLQTLEQCFMERITLMPGAATLVATLRAHGAYCLLVSGGFTYFTQRVAALTGFHDHKGNTLIYKDNVLTGEVGQPILGREAKLQALDSTAEKLGLNRDLTLAMGDGANDLAIIKAAGLGLAVHAKPVVSTAASAAIDQTDLTAALYFQGYSDSEIIWKT